MAEYRILYARTLTKEVLGELPVDDGFSFGDVLNGPGSLEATVPLRMKAPARTGSYEALTAEELAPGRTDLYVERDGVIVWGGILWTAAADVGANVVRLGAEGFHSYWRRRFIRETRSYTGVTGPMIAKDLIDYAQAVPGGSIGVDTSGVTAQGDTRDRTYFGYERKNLGEALEQLAAVQGGFDFRYEVAWDGSTPAVRLVTSYPATGRRTNFVLDAGTNMSVLAVTVDATTMAWTVDAVGAGEGDTLPIRTTADPALTNVYPLLEDVLALTDVREDATLDAHAARRLDRGRAPMTIPAITLYGDAEPVVGAYEVGDQVRVRASIGFVDLDTIYRLTESRVSVDRNGTEAVAVTAAPLEAFNG